MWSLRLWFAPAERASRSRHNKNIALTLLSGRPSFGSAAALPRFPVVLLDGRSAASSVAAAPSSAGAAARQRQSTAKMVRVIDGYAFRGKDEASGGDGRRPEQRQAGAEGARGGQGASAADKSRHSKEAAVLDKFMEKEGQQSPSDVLFPMLDDAFNSPGAVILVVFHPCITLYP